MGPELFDPALRLRYYLVPTSYKVYGVPSHTVPSRLVHIRDSRGTLGMYLCMVQVQSSYQPSIVNFIRLDEMVGHN